MKARRVKARSASLRTQGSLTNEADVRPRWSNASPPCECYVQALCRSATRPGKTRRIRRATAVGGSNRAFFFSMLNFASAERGELLNLAIRSREPSAPSRDAAPARFATEVGVVSCFDERKARVAFRATKTARLLPQVRISKDDRARGAHTSSQDRTGDLQRVRLTS